MTLDAGMRAGDRRAAVPRFTVWERRSGFDPRHAGGVLQDVSRQSALLLAVLAALNALSLVDWVLTTRLLAAGALEANPVVGALLSVSPLGGGVAKLVLMLAVSIAIWSGRRFRLVVAVAVGASVFYVPLVAYELVKLASVT